MTQSLEGSGYKLSGEMPLAGQAAILVIID